MEKVIRNGKVAVIISPGFGGGWSTWNSSCREKCVFDPTLVGLIEVDAPRRSIEDYISQAFGEDVFVPDQKFRVEWVPVGQQFRINEYDGSESVILLGEDENVYTA